jgi:hypothetical protein
VRAKEGERELRSEGKRCGALWGWCSPFIGWRGALGRGVQGGNGRRYGLNAIDGWSGIKSG